MLRRLSLLAAVAAAASGTSDAYFPAFHVRPVTNWVNDPNGPLYFNGRYHLWMQYNPTGAVWGNMAWFHTDSEDLVTFQRLGVSPDRTE